MCSLAMVPQKMYPGRGGARGNGQIMINILVRSERKESKE